jgi:hypothetical protein
MPKFLVAAAQRPRDLHRSGGAALTHSTPPSTEDAAKIAHVLQRTRATLRRVELALDSFPKTPDRERQVAAMHNVVMTGRAVTFVLQNMQHVAPNFHSWYKPWQDEMRKDPLLWYFKDLRNEIEKQGREGVVNITHINSFDGSRDMPPAPPGAVGFFMGDENGGNGWEVQLEDGTTQKIYIELPESIGRSWFAFEGLPDEHLDSPITEDTLESVSQLYVNYLQRLVNAAEEQFSPPRLSGHHIPRWPRMTFTIRAPVRAAWILRV